MHEVLQAGAQIAEHVPVVLMCYANLIYARGPERFAADLAQRGISGLIVPDLPLEESEAILAACDANSIALVPLVAPTTPDARLDAIGRKARGFVYTVSVTGTTGERDAGGGDAASLLARVKAHSPVPVALGFGISTGAHAAAAADAGADGVIVGSRLVRAVAEAAEQARIRPPPRVRWSLNLPPPSSASLRAAWDWCSRSPPAGCSRSSCGPPA